MRRRLGVPSKRASASIGTRPSEDCRPQGALSFPAGPWRTIFLFCVASYAVSGRVVSIPSGGAKDASQAARSRVRAKRPLRPFKENV